MTLQSFAPLGPLAALAALALAALAWGAFRLARHHPKKAASPLPWDSHYAEWLGAEAFVSLAFEPAPVPSAVAARGLASAARSL